MKKIGKYEIVRELGKGATSIVYLASDPFANRAVAIKLVLAETLDDKELGKRFQKLFLTEASLAGKLSHPHIAAIYDAASEQAGSYLVMSHAAAETYQPDSDQGKAAGSVYKQQAATAGAVRTRADIERFFAGFELVDPGIVWVTEWRPDGEVPPEFADHPERCGIWAAVGRKV